METVTFFLTAEDADGTPHHLAGTVTPHGTHHLRVVLDSAAPPGGRTILLPASLGAVELYQRIAAHLGLRRAA